MSDGPFAKWRGWVAAGLLAIVAVIIFAAWPKTPAKVSAPIAAAPPTTRLAPPPLQVLDRRALIDAAGSAASSYAAGMPIDQKVAELAGKRFALILPFGCDGPTPPNDDELANGWRYSSETSVLQVAFPSSIQSSASIENSPSADDGPIFSKGFWIEREWLRSGSCPTPKQDQNEQSDAPDQPTLAIVELTVSEAPRAESREGVPYRVSNRLSTEQAPTGKGLRIVITGRLAADGVVPIQCWSAHRNKRPTCIILARFDGVAVTDSSGSQRYGEWSD